MSLWSKRGFAELDGRLVEAREEVRIVRSLTAEAGKPSFAKTVMIKRCARLVIMCSQLERRAIERAELGDLEQRQLCALSNSLRLYLQALGLERPEQQVPNLADYITSKRPAA